MGSMKTIEEGTEHPGISSNHTLIIHSLHNPIQNSIHTNWVEGLRPCSVMNIQNKYENLMQHADFADNRA
jgi:hypothetical protein